MHNKILDLTNKSVEMYVDIIIWTKTLITKSIYSPVLLLPTNGKLLNSSDAQIKWNMTECTKSSFNDCEIKQYNRNTMRVLMASWVGTHLYTRHYNIKYHDAYLTISINPNRFNLISLSFFQRKIETGIEYRWNGERYTTHSAVSIILSTKQGSKLYHCSHDIHY